MTGLIRNNFYTVEGSLKTTILVGVIAMIASSIAGIYVPDNATLSVCVISGMLGAFGALAGTAIQKDGASKWNKFELTMPISRNDVIKARYLSFVLYIIIGIFSKERTEGGLNKRASCCALLFNPLLVFPN